MWNWCVTSDRLPLCVFTCVRVTGDTLQTLLVQFNGATWGEVLHYLRIESLTLKRLWGLEVLPWPFAKAPNAWANGRTVRVDVHTAASPFETARAQNSLDPIKSFCLSPILPSWLCCLFLLCVIHIHSITLLPSVSVPQCISPRLPGRCFSWCRAIWILGAEMLRLTRTPGVNLGSNHQELNN